MTLWNDTNLQPDAGKEGLIASDKGKDTISRYAEGAIRAGLLVEQGTAYNQVAPLSALPADDPNAIATAIASNAAVQELSGATFDGVIGAGKISPPRSVTITADSNADWGLAAQGFTVVEVIGLDANGNQISDKLHLPAGGNVTLETEAAFSQVSRVLIGACDGNTGTGEIGLSTNQVALSTIDYGVAVYDMGQEGDPDSVTTYADEDSLPVLEKGQVWVVVEAAVVPGDAVGVRVVLDGTDVRGQFSKYPSEASATAEFAPLVGAKFVTAASADELAIVELR